MTLQCVFANGVQTTLSAAATSTATSLALTSSAGLPTLAAGQFMPVFLRDAATRAVLEICYATAITGATLTVTRAQEGTTAQAWSAGDYVWCGPTAGTTPGLQNVQNGSMNFALDTGAVNAYAISLTPVPTAYVDGMPISFVTPNSNTITNPTMNVGGLGVITITNPGGSALIVGQIIANAVTHGFYNSTGPRIELAQGLTEPVADARYAALAGLSTQVFNVANAATATEAVAYGQADGRYTHSGADGSASNKKVISGSYQILASDSGLILDPWSATAGFVLTLPLAGTTAPSGFNLIIGPNQNGGSISNPSASGVDMYYPDGTVSSSGGRFTMPAGVGKAFRIYEFAGSFRIETIGRTIVAPAVSSNEATAFSQVFGLGQTRNAVTASRATNTVYTNPSATKPMFVFVCISNVAGGTSNWINNGVSVVISGNATGATVNQTFSDIVLPGQTYELSTTTDGIISWSETY